MKIIMSALLSLACLFAPDALSFADSVTLRAVVSKTASYGIPKTGNPSYVSYDDGYYNKGTPLTGPRFTDNGNNTVIDNGTGLMWIKDPSQIPGGTWGTPGSPAHMYWLTGLANCHALAVSNYAGHSDWRMPNIAELWSLLYYISSVPTSPLIDPTYFPNTAYNYYWTSTGYYIQSWTVCFSPYISPRGAVSFMNNNSNCHVRPVRGPD